MAETPAETAAETPAEAPADAPAEAPAATAAAGRPLPAGVDHDTVVARMTEVVVELEAIAATPDVLDDGKHPDDRALTERMRVLEETFRTLTLTGIQEPALRSRVQTARAIYRQRRGPTAPRRAPSSGRGPGRPNVRCWSRLSRSRSWRRAPRCPSSPAAASAKRSPRSRSPEDVVAADRDHRGHRAPGRGEAPRTPPSSRSTPPSPTARSPTSRPTQHRSRRLTSRPATSLPRL